MSELRQDVREFILLRFGFARGAEIIALTEFVQRREQAAREEERQRCAKPVRDLIEEWERIANECEEDDDEDGSIESECVLNALRFALKEIESAAIRKGSP